MTSKNDPAALQSLVGQWRTEGRTIADGDAPAVDFAGRDDYAWLPGKQFLIHRVDVRMSEERVQGIEIIGADPDGDDYFVQWYGSDGGLQRYRATLEHGVWRVQSTNERFEGEFAADGGRLSGRWERSDDGSGWRPWMTVTLAKAASADSETD